MGLQGPEIILFVREQQEISREERRTQREEAREDARASSSSKRT